jgi:hypothetical protein
MQHDTSPHTVEVGGRKHKAQTASAVLCYSRMLFFQINPTFQRFDCKRPHACGVDDDAGSQSCSQGGSL